MTEAKKPREFWLDLDPMAVYQIFENPVSSITKDETIHVIEYSAYKAVVSENENLKADKARLMAQLTDFTGDS